MSKVLPATGEQRMSVTSATWIVGRMGRWRGCSRNRLSLLGSTKLKKMLRGSGRRNSVRTEIQLWYALFFSHILQSFLTSSTHIVACSNIKLACCCRFFISRIHMKEYLDVRRNKNKKTNKHVTKTSNKSNQGSD
jgi:hypothetical protein